MGKKIGVPPWTPIYVLKCNKQYQNEKFTPLNEMTSIRVYVGDTRVLASPSPSLFFTPVLYFSDQDVEPRAKKKRQENNNSID